MSAGGRFPRVATWPIVWVTRFPFYCAANISAFPIADVPAVSNANDLPLLFSVPHTYFPPFLLRSRAATASFAIRLNSAADSFAALAFPPLLAILAISAGDKFSALALPPRLPSACAFGFFFRLMQGLSYLAISTSRGKYDISAASSPAILLAGVIPIRTGRSGQAGCRGFVHFSGSERGCGSESKIPGLATASLAPGNRSIPRRSREFGTSMGHLVFQGSCFQSVSYTHLTLPTICSV